MQDIIESKYNDMKEMLLRNLKICPDSPAILIKTSADEFTTITHEQFVQDVFSLGTALISRGYKDKKIAIYGKNNYEWLVAYFAVFCGVGTVVPLDVQFSSEEVERTLARVNCEAIFYSKETAGKLDAVKNKLPNIQYIPCKGDGEVTIESLIKEGHQQIEDGNRAFVDAKIDSEAPLSFVSTSGTTSIPKIAMLSHKNIVFNIKSVTQPIPMYTWDVFYNILPFNHVLGTLDFCLALSAGASIAICDNLKSIQKDMQITRATFTIVVPRVLEMFVSGINSKIAKKGLVGKVANHMARITNITDRMGITDKRKVFSEIHEAFGGNLRVIIVGGAPMNPKDAERMEALGFNVRQGYGLTECAPLVAVNGTGKKYKHDSVGQPIPGCDVKIANPDEEGIGEVAVKGDQVMVGYYEDPEATAETLREDGFLYTGDLGFMDRYKFIKLTGRSKNIIVFQSGKKVAPEELETLIGTTDIITAVIVSLETTPNGRETLVAEFEVIEEIREQIKNNPEMRKIVEDKIGETVSAVNSKVADYKRIQRIKISDTTFERTSALKVKRYAK